MFGFVILFNNYQNAEWGYIDYKELKDLNIKCFEVERDLHWKPRRAGLVERIVRGGGV